MGKKTGQTAKYIDYGGQTLQYSVNGHILGVSYHPKNKSYYTMLPKPLAGDKAKRSKQVWLGSDLTMAVAKFNALVNNLKGEKEKTITTPVKMLRFGANQLEYLDELGNDNYPSEPMPIDESHYIQWLKTELQNPKELARKTGIAELAYLNRLLIQDNNIELKAILENYLSKKRAITEKEAYHSKLFFNEFSEVIDCKTIDAITLKDIHKYEDFLHSQKTKDGKDASPKTIKNKMNKISSIFKYNLGRYNSTALQQVYNWIRGLDRPSEDKPFNPILMSLKDFNALYEVSNFKWRLMLLLGLNCAMYPIDLARLQKEHINFENGTIAFRRGKTGKVLAVSTLWTRTKELLNQYLAERKIDSEHIFITKFGSPYKASGITNSFNETIRTKAKVNDKVKFNHLRDTFSTLAQDKGFNIEQINLVLGHKNKGMQDRYAVRQASNLTKELCEAVETAYFKANNRG